MRDISKQELSTLAAEAQAGSISRRQFMARTAALGAGGVLSSGLLSQAGAGSDSEDGRQVPGRGCPRLDYGLPGPRDLRERLHVGSPT